MGRSVRGAGDINNDGFDDFLMGATWSDQYAGKVYLVYGKETGWEQNISASQTDASFLGEASYDYAGFSLVSTGDLNGDGNHDFLIGAAYYGSRYVGKSYLFLSDAPILGDFGRDLDVDGEDISIVCSDLSAVDLKKFAALFGYCANE